MGDIGMRTSNDPVFQVGERVLVFLNAKEVVPRLVGLSQGKYMVKGGMVTRDGQAMTVADFISAILSALQME